MNDLAHRADGLSIRLASSDGARPEGANQLTQTWDSVRLDLGHEVDGPR
jgi:hypothetical protein